MIDRVIQTGIVGIFTALFLLLVGMAAWFQHLYTCFTDESWGFLIAGAIFFPIAIIHGIGVWFGIW